MSETTTTRRTNACKNCNEQDCVCTPEEKYIRLANARGDKFVHICKLLRNLGDSYAYTINAELAEELLEKFDAKLEEVRISWTREIAKAREAPTEVEPEVVSVD